jgi:DNA-binding transcriptional LysR family regulator
VINNARELDEMFTGGDNRIGGTLRLGASRTLASYVMPEILSGFATDHPAVQLEVVSRNKTGIIEQIENFSLDIGVIAGGASRPDVRSHPWLKDDLCVFCASSHPLARKNQLSASDLAQSHWILREEGSGTLEVFYNALPEYLKPLNVLMVLDNIESIKRTVEHVDALSCVSRFALRREVESGILTVLKTPFLDLRRNYSFLVHREKENSLLTNYFIRTCLLSAE